MENIKLNELKKDPVFRTIMFFIAILCVATILIMLGRRNDAVTLAEQYKAGVLTADEVNTAFENVGGRLVKRYVNESDYVHKGDLLMELDPRDYEIEVRRLEANVKNLNAQISHEEKDIENSLKKLDTQRDQTYRQIEKLDANIKGAQAVLSQAQAEYSRYSSLNQSSSVSKSAYDNALSAYRQAKSNLDALISSIKELSTGATDEQVEKLKTTGSAQGMSLNSIDEALLDIRNLDNTLSALKASRDATEAELAQKKLNLSRTKLYAPCDGKVLNVMFNEGELVAAGAPAVNIETDRYYYDVYVSELSVQSTILKIASEAMLRLLTRRLKAPSAMCRLPLHLLTCA